MTASEKKTKKCRIVLVNKREPDNLHFMPFTRKLNACLFLAGCLLELAGLLAQVFCRSPSHLVGQTVVFFQQVKFKISLKGF